MRFCSHFERKSPNIYWQPKHFEETLQSNVNLFLFYPAYVLPGSHVVYDVTKRKENLWCAVWGQQTVVWFWWNLMLDVVTQICKITLHFVKIEEESDLYSWQTDRVRNNALWLHFLKSLVFSNVLSLLILTAWLQDRSADSRDGVHWRALVSILWNLGFQKRW